MGAAESRPAPERSGTQTQYRLTAGEPKQGYHVIRVAQESPAQVAGVCVLGEANASEPFFDFCIGINGQPLVNMSSDPRHVQDTTASEARAAWSMVEQHEGQAIVLNVWNSKRQEYRGACEIFTADVTILPSRSWSTTTTTSHEEQPSLLGLTVRLCSPANTINHVWHILDVLEGSPADSAGLVPYGDYVIGWTGGPLQHENDFFQLIEHYTNRHIALYVYNSDYDHTREVVIVPNRHWGGEGLLGCGIGYGLLRTCSTTNTDRIPKPAQQQYEDNTDATTWDPAASPAPTAQAPRLAQPPTESHLAPAPTAQSHVGVTLNMHAEEEE